MKRKIQPRPETDFTAIRLSIGNEIHRRIKAAAAIRGITLHSWCVEALADCAEAATKFK